MKMNRVYSLGSEWVYFKMYSGYKIADVILLEYLKDKIELLESKKILKNGFSYDITIQIAMLEFDYKRINPKMFSSDKRTESYF